MAAQAKIASGPKPLLGLEAFGYWKSFSKNILDFLAAQGTEVQLPELPSIRCWFVILSDGARLHIYAEQVSEESATCDQCRIIGAYITRLLECKVSIFEFLVITFDLCLCRLGLASCQ